jgi:hypothetical protein
VRTPENVRQSGADEHFIDWVKMYIGDDLFNCHDSHQSVMTCYVSTFLGNHDFKCSIADQSRCPIPTAEEVMAATKNRFRDMPAMDQVETAKSVYYTLKNFESIGSNAWMLYVSSFPSNYEVGCISNFRRICSTR